MSEFSKIHKSVSGHSLRSEQVSGEKSGKSKAELLREILAHDRKYNSPKQRAIAKKLKSNHKHFELNRGL